ncbi:hypothetical protein KHA94_24070 [Bacillus sp. FJAT-49705]|uniref:Uncharacterized protein n=1 Tax=Cytobacillus citreus TaxID=2833586 RepID=A0ABS5P012_9BACI|nr:hypothetical protein [Cytobacillus citreus]
MQTHLEFKQIYRSVKIAKTLKKRGVKVSERTVSRIITKNNWKSCTVKKYYERRLSHGYLQIVGGEYLTLTLV